MSVTACASNSRHYQEPLQASASSSSTAAQRYGHRLHISEYRSVGFIRSLPLTSGLLLDSLDAIRKAFQLKYESSLLGVLLGYERCAPVNTPVRHKDCAVPPIFSSSHDDIRQVAEIYVVENSE
jgi:hypothetical protein